MAHRTQTQSQPNKRTQPQPLSGKGLSPILCIIMALVLLGLLLGFVIVMMYLTLTPKRPVYTIESASVQDLAISKDDHISAKFNYMINSSNPNNHFSVRYHSMSISTVHHNQGIIAQTKISGFTQRPRNTTSIKTQLVSDNVTLLMADAKELRAEETKGVIETEVYITAKVSFRAWFFPTRRHTLKVACKTVMINVKAKSLVKVQGVTCKTRI